MHDGLRLDGGAKHTENNFQHWLFRWSLVICRVDWLSEDASFGTHVRGPTQDL